MARLEYINYEPFQACVGDGEKLIWTSQSTPPIADLPQIYWEDRTSWDEANVWALERRSSQLDPETIKRTMKHLCRYASFIEATGVSWQHFPVRKDERVTQKFRKYLVDEMKCGSLANSTASNCINAVITFYRFANLNKLIRPNGPMWSDRLVVIRIYDTAGFERSLVRMSTDLSIPNRARIGSGLEDGLLPLTAEHMTTLLTYTSRHETDELHLMLSIGFFTGARLGTITTLTVSCLQTARVDPNTPGLYLLPVGPGTGVATKFSVIGNLLIPEAVLIDLRNYATSKTRLLREIKAERDDKDVLFLARSGRPYTVTTVDRLVLETRKKAVRAGFRFMERFKFHQSRATFGTWLLQLLLQYVTPAVALGIVRDAMLHKDEDTTMGYIKFLEKTKAKGKFAAEFNAAFTGLKNRNWNKVDA